MRRVLAIDHGGSLYAKRQTMIEPVFADTRFNRGIDRFLTPRASGRQSEWRLAAAGHNRLNLYRHSAATQTA